MAFRQAASIFCPRATCGRPASSAAPKIGANYEVTPWVVGIEASWTDSAIDGNTLVGCSGGCAIGATPTPQERLTSQAKWFAALTGRVGYAANDWLFYAKAGGGWMNVNIPRIFSVPEL